MHAPPGTGAAASTPSPLTWPAASQCGTAPRRSPPPAGAATAAPPRPTEVSPLRAPAGQRQRQRRVRREPRGQMQTGRRHVVSQQALPVAQTPPHQTRLQCADHARHHAQHTRIHATRTVASRGSFGEQAAVAGPCSGGAQSGHAEVGAEYRQYAAMRMRKAVPCKPRRGKPAAPFTVLAVAVHSQLAVGADGGARHQRPPRHAAGVAAGYRGTAAWKVG